MNRAVTFSAGAVLLAFSVGVAQAAEPAITGSWHTEEQVKARLIADGGTQNGGARLVGIEIVLADGWKTYWRTPGTSGVPPAFNWSESMDLGSAEVLYPAPRRFIDKEDQTIGYKGTVVWPVMVRPSNASGGVRLKLALELGVCLDICVPVQLDLAMTLPANPSARAVPYVAPWLERVPRTTAARRPNDPEIVATVADLKHSRPHVRVTARYPTKASDADLFPEAPDGLYVPLPTKSVSADGRTVDFDIDLSRDVELKELVGKMLRFTVVGGGGAVESSWKLQ